MVTVLGNLADNISEAVKEQKNANVYIRIETTEDEFLIYTKNPVSKERHKKKESMVSWAWIAECYICGGTIWWLCRV